MKLIYKDSGAANTFTRNLSAAVTKANDLIELFNTHQPFATIESMMSFAALVHDPVGYYDSVLTDNIQHDSRFAVDPGKLAELYNIPRQQYLVGLGMTQQQASKCHNCNGEKDITIKLKVLTPDQYSEFVKYFTFAQGRIQVNSEKVEQHKDTFNVYADNHEAVALVEHYESLCNVLNDALDYHKAGGQSNLQALARMFGFQVLDNRLVVNYYALSQQIKNISYANVRSF